MQATFENVVIATDPTPLRWRLVGFGGSCGEEEAATQEVKLGAAVHGAFEQLEAIDLPLVLFAAPLQAKAGPDRDLVLTEACSESLDQLHAAGTGVRGLASKVGMMLGSAGAAPQRPRTIRQNRRSGSTTWQPHHPAARVRP